MFNKLAASIIALEHDSKEPIHIVNFKELIIKKALASNEESFWHDFGYIYLGVFSLKATKREDVLKDIPDKYSFAKEVLQAMYYGIDDKFEDLTGSLKESLAEVCKGIEEFYKESKALGIDNSFFKSIEEFMLKFINDELTRYELYRLMEFRKTVIYDNNTYNLPLNKKGRFKIGIVNPWPGDLSAESEVVTRINASAREAGIECELLSDWGHILNEADQKKTKKFVEEDELDFVITTHYVSHKSLDAFYYHALWNPPEIPLNLDEYTDYVSDNYLMNDDYLTYDMGGMTGHLKTILMNKNRNLDGASMLTASFPKSSMLEVKLENPKMFYCGMNWDKLVHNENRHEGLFKLLDETEKVKFFGPDIMKNWGGIRPWKGYKCYQYPIPWDGFSILKEINECGVCLVISSDIHRRAGAVTNRAYEACAAGAVMISDNNEFMKEHFSDAALFIYYNRKDPKDTFRQIMEKYEWIITHKEEAKQLVKRAQEIFKEKFALDRQLLGIVQNHPNRFKTIADDLFAKNTDKKVLVTYILNSIEKEDIKSKLEIVINNIETQYYQNISLVIGADERVSEFVKEYADSRYFGIKVQALELFDQKGVRSMTDGAAIREIQKSEPHDYYMNTGAREKWFYDHVTTLVRTIEDSGYYIAYSGRLFLDSADNYRRRDFFDIYLDTDIYSMSDARTAETPGQFLFVREASEFVPDYVMELMDGIEHYAYMGLIQIRNSKTSTFSKRMTIIDNGYIYDDRKSVIGYMMQVRLIRDIVRFELKERKAGGDSFSLNPLGQLHPAMLYMVKESYLKVPLRNLISYRWNMGWARIFGYDSIIGRKCVEKAQRKRRLFLEYWNK